jgi:cardiolipin synthase
MFGENRLGKRRAERSEAMMGTVHSWLQAVRDDSDATRVAATAPEGSMARHAEHALGIPPLAGNRLELLDDTESIFDALVADIDAAKVRCLLGFYIWHEGGRADDVIAALVRAAERGVECRVSADAIGSKVFLRSGRVDALRHAGVKVVTALATGLLRSLFVRVDLRNHRKIAVIDDRIGYTGSQNLVDPDFFKQDEVGLHLCQHAAGDLGNHRDAVAVPDPARQRGLAGGVRADEVDAGDVRAEHGSGRSSTSARGPC